MLFRATYYRENRIRGMTFAARSPELAAAFAHTKIESVVGVPVLTVKKVESKGSAQRELFST